MQFNNQILYLLKDLKSCRSSQPTYAKTAGVCIFDFPPHDSSSITFEAVLNGEQTFQTEDGVLKEFMSFHKHLRH